MRNGPSAALTLICMSFLLYSELWSESRSRTVVLQQPESESVQPGDSVTLQCTVHTETCAGEDSVYWFRQGSGESLPGIIYTHGNRSDECQRSSGAVSPTQSCVYNFPKRNLSLSDAGTYYCAVATCGEILFGNGTKLDFEGEHSVYWFRQGSGESPPGIIYTYGNRSDECQRSSGAVSPTQSCVYNFPKRNLSLSDAGTYYCAVATCGEILFGNGTKLDIEGEHSVYWFRQGSGESPPEIIYTHGNRSDECQRSSGAVSPTQSCVYKFPKRNLSLSDAGTYYCAVATCGEILFGNGTKLDTEGENVVRIVKGLHQKTKCLEKSCQGSSIKMKQ
ncbi:hypothetical protein SKAU_G00366620 [Synaphobranchus kaupii]|uniref:Ig-like domain-containing protein n=1 Tax=Synaphobranchus kaupii TaxID=118154 RepID=A0A9Q1IFJ5_SYNKA|nr:hypothetical protein SKAU_G00366620 [Synaphobranchus kaupii]